MLSQLFKRNPSFKWSLSRERSYGALKILHPEGFACGGGTRTGRIRRQQSNFVSDDPTEEALVVNCQVTPIGACKEIFRSLTPYPCGQSKTV